MKPKTVHEASEAKNTGYIMRPVKPKTLNDFRSESGVTWQVQQSISNCNSFSRDNGAQYGRYVHVGITETDLQYAISGDLKGRLQNE